MLREVVRVQCASQPHESLEASKAKRIKEIDAEFKIEDKGEEGVDLKHDGYAYLRFLSKTQN